MKLKSSVAKHHYAKSKTQPYIIMSKLDRNTEIKILELCRNQCYFVRDAQSYPAILECYKRCVEINKRFEENQKALEERSQEQEVMMRRYGECLMRRTGICSPPFF